ncbi:hypothetical protein GCK32_010682 [Trichostrongylus colubriformis]|uniref:Secreted protein n=1 Tax=Trichostrongylus colubriformis TaxID=6319 RepID=A0AAN8FT22_TRICO
MRIAFVILFAVCAVMCVVDESHSQENNHNGEYPGTTTTVPPALPDAIPMPDQPGPESQVIRRLVGPMSNDDSWDHQHLKSESQMD